MELTAMAQRLATGCGSDMGLTHIDGRSFDGERSLYGARGMCLSNVTFGGPADGESPLKEASHKDRVF